jgi:E3 ubiquitin-protein ligase DOA10
MEIYDLQENDLSVKSISYSKQSVGNARTCRICLESETDDALQSSSEHRLIAPCQCSGSVQYVH